MIVWEWRKETGGLFWVSQPAAANHNKWCWYECNTAIVLLRSMPEKTTYQQGEREDRGVEIDHHVATLWPNNNYHCPQYHLPYYHCLPPSPKPRSSLRFYIFSLPHYLIILSDKLLALLTTHLLTELLFAFIFMFSLFNSMRTIKTWIVVWRGSVVTNIHDGLHGASIRISSGRSFTIMIRLGCGAQVAEQFGYYRR